MSEQSIADTLAKKATFYGVRVEMRGLQRWFISVMDKARALAENAG